MGLPDDLVGLQGQVGVVTTLYPVGYGHELLPMEKVRERYASKFHPVAWKLHEDYMVHMGGLLGPGGGWRPTPSDTSEASRLGKSFHQTQTYASGTKGCCAIDYVARNGNNVHRAPRTGELPIQGSPEAAEWGIHANVGRPGSGGWEPWHAQPIQMDGYDTWLHQGRPDPRPVASKPEPPPPPKPTPKEAVDMIRLDLNPGTDWWVSMVMSATTITHVVDGYHAQVLEEGNVPRVVVDERDVEGILRSLRATNKSPFAAGKPSHNDHLDVLWNAAM